MIRLPRPALAALLLLLPMAAGPADAEDEKYFRAPNFTATDLEGQRVQLEDYLGRGPILVDFWATWCKPCIKELPYIQRLHDDYAEAGLQVLAVTIDSPKSQSRVKPFLKGRKFTFPVLFDGSQEVFQALQGKGSVPYVVVLDSEGNVRYRHTGYRPGDEKELASVVKELMAEAGMLPDGEDGAAVAAPVEAPAG